jgi:sphingolipid delta-4 desaturase
MGVDGLDSDIPTAMEAFLLNSFLGKVFFCTFQIFFYAVRPMCIYQQPFSQLQLFNLFAQLAFNFCLGHFVGWNALIYLAMSSILSGSLHPCAGHFIAEHYVFSYTNGNMKKTPHDPTIALPETYSYYGSLNALTYNVGYHNEHHDFPAIPWSRLPTLHRIAHEFYKDLPSHPCWVHVIWQFMTDDGIGLWCRVKRAGGGRKVGDNNNNAWKEEELDANDGCHGKKLS